MSGERLDEEGRGLLRQIVEAQGYRQLMAGSTRGFGRMGVEFPEDLQGRSATHGPQA